MGGTVDTLKKAFLCTVPLIPGYVFIGIAFGMIFVDSGNSPWWAVLMSIVVYAGSLQFLAVNFFVPGFSVLQAVFLTAMVNMRHVFYGLSLVHRYNRFGRRRWYMIFGMTDETYSLACTTGIPEGVDEESFLFDVTLLNHLYWVLGTAVGAVAATSMSFDTRGIDFAMTAMFLVMFVEMWCHRTNRPSELIGVASAVVCLIVFGTENFVIPAMVLMVAVLLIGGRRIGYAEAKDDRRRLGPDPDTRHGRHDVRDARGIVPAVPQGQGGASEGGLSGEGPASRDHRDAGGLLPEVDAGRGVSVRDPGADSMHCRDRAPSVEEELAAEHRRRDGDLHAARASGVPVRYRRYYAEDIALNPSIAKTRAEDIREQMVARHLCRREYLLLISLMAFSFIPSINQLIVDRLVSGMGSAVLNIAGQIEWFDLFNETILAFMTVPMYFIFNKAKDDTDLSSRINQTLTMGFIAYTTVSVIIFLYANTLTAYMNAPSESIEYLRLETIGFIVGFLSSYMYVVFVVRGKYDYIVAILIAKVVMLSIGNLVIIPANGVIGIAMTNIGVNLTLSVISLILLHKEKLIRKWDGFRKDVLKDWVRTGLFSGGQVFLANTVYMLIVVKMINEASQVGNYWLANNFIWGWLLIPIFAIGEMVKREYYNGYYRIWNYLALVGIVVLVWIASIPLWGVMFRDVIGAEDTETILGILYKLVPFYVAYALSTVFQGVLTSIGRTDYLFMESAIVNLVYYGIMYGLFQTGVFEASMKFVIMLFGFGMVLCTILDIIFYLRSEKIHLLQY